MAPSILALLQGEGSIALPGAYDALSARCAEVAGCRALHVTGAGVSCSMGYPDVGLVTQTEMVDRVREIARVVDLPVIADADTGYGGVTNVRRTVEMFEAAGVAGIHLEDQREPKRCGQLAGKTVIPVEEMQTKIEAAIAARRSPDFCIVARTDARESGGVAEVIKRCTAYFEAGAHCVFPMALQSEDDLRRVAKAVPGPKMITATHGGKTPMLARDEFAALGYRLVVFAMSPLMTATHALQAVMAAIARDGSDQAVRDSLTPMLDVYNLVGLADYQSWEQRFATR